MKANWLLLLYACIFLAGCNTEPKEFAYTFTMESTDAYKLTLTIDHNKQYTIQEQYIFFERRSKNPEKPKQQKGTMNEDEFAEFKQLLTKSNLFKMKESYGFDQETDHALSDVVYHISYQADAKEKFISIRLNDSQQFPLPFTQLIEYTNTFISKYKEK